jgi:hypothetical protein
MQKLKKILFTTLAVFLSYIAVGQVTTSSISGSVKDKSGAGLEGATITATHTPTGTVYVTVSKKGGTFNVPNARIGGPYTLKVEYVGYQAQTLEDINLQLGEPYGVSVVMGEDVKTVTEVIVTGGRRKVFADKSGPSTVLGQQQIKTIPNFSRNIVDFTSITPQAGSNNAFGGRDGRFNNIQVDGANLNNNFGLRADPFPGGSISSPISLDAIEEVSVNIAPFDIRQSGFTGAGINAVTKSGSNRFRGGVYGYLRTQDMNGRKVGDSTLPKLLTSRTNFIGGYVGGPIIKNKLFFFVSGEFEKREFPGIQFQPKGSTGGLNSSSTPIDSLKILSDFLRNTYQYETGVFDNFPNYQLENRKILAKIDWNISKVHKLSLRFNDYVNTNDEDLNGSSVINNGTFSVTTATGTTSISRLPNNRFGPFSMSYANSRYGFKNIVRSGAFELNSSSKGKWSNQFLATFTITRATRTSPGKDFPMIDIFNGVGQNQISVGYEPFSYNNDVKNNTFNVTNNLTYFAGKHTLIFGATYEQQYLGNSFMPGAQSYYVFNTLNDLLTNQAPRYFAYTYSLVPGKSQVYSAELKLGQAALYVQDEINVNSKFKLTLGLRADKPVYLENPLPNAAINALTLVGKDGQNRQYNTAQWPSSKLLWSPRIAFRYDVAGDKSTIIRGGTGIFTGRIPFVWLTNMPTNSGVYQAQQVITDLNRLKGFTFRPNINAYRDSFPSSITPTVPTNFVLIDPEFKFPSIWRTYVAFEKSLRGGWLLTSEFSFARDINAVIMRNANLRAPDAAFSGPDTRPRYTSSANAVRRVNPAFGQAIVLENTKEGFSTFATFGVSKSFTKGFYSSLSYTYTSAVDYSGNPGAQAGTAWSGIAGVGTANMPELGWNADLRPHRILGVLSYKKEYLKRLASTVTIVYDGSTAGTFSFITNGDLNNDGNNNVDLLYIPRDASELTFLPITPSAANNFSTYSVQAQIDAFNKFIDNTPYLSKRRGSYAQRNAATLPFYHRVNLSFRQDFYTFVTKTGRKQSLQLTADVFNFLNMLNKDWGIRPLTVVTDPIVSAGPNASGVPQYRMRVVNGQLPTRVYQTNFSTSSTWGAQLGVRYEF